jgi:predicted nucleic acid-binding protein
MWRLLVEDGRKVGHTFSRPDLIIAAAAVYRGLTVVTRDVGGRRAPPARQANSDRAWRATRLPF